MKHARPDYNRIQDPALYEPGLLSEGSTPIGEDEPVFLLRAQDKHAAKMLIIYAAELEADPDVDPEMAKLCLKWARTMAQWPYKKSPDMPM